MTIINFIKNLFSSEQQKPTEPKDLAIQDLGPWIQSKNQELEKQDQEFSKKITNIKKELTNNLKEKLRELEDYNLDNKKADQRVKSIVEENFNNYFRYTEKLISNLNDLTITNSQLLIQEIDLLLMNFQEKSNISYQKATFLIGEIGAIKDSIDNFTKQLKNLINKNQELIKTTEILSLLTQKQEELNKIENTEDQIKNILKSIKTKETHIKNQVEEIENQITNIKNSKEYKEEIKQKNRIDQENINLTTQLNNLKKIIDFKDLAHKYHSIEKEMNIIKDHRDNFQAAFEKDNGKNLEELTNKKSITEKIQEIRNLKKHINNQENNLSLKTGVEISLKETEITKLEQEIKDQKTEQEKNKKLLSKITDEKQQIISQIKTNLQSLNINLVSE